MTKELLLAHTSMNNNINEGSLCVLVGNDCNIAR